MEAAGTLFRVPSMPSDADSTRAWMRLVKAVAASFLLHVALLVGIPVNPTGGVPQMVSTLTARLEPAAPPSEAVPDSVALVPDVAPDPKPEPPPVTVQWDTVDPTKRILPLE